jgi:hypothetical protein
LSPIVVDISPHAIFLDNVSATRSLKVVMPVLPLTVKNALYVGPTRRLTREGEATTAPGRRPPADSTVDKEQESK